MHIGELARRTGLSVKTVRYYADLGLVPQTSRTTSGYRRFDATAVVRLEFVRTLRELGLDLATVGQVLERHTDLPKVAAAHAEALGVQIRLLRVQRAVLRVLARREPTPKEVEHMSRIAPATADERRRLVQDFLDSIFDVDVRPDREQEKREFEERFRRATPELPDDASDEQVDAWIELAELMRDTEFRERLREMGRRNFSGGRQTADPGDMPRLAGLITAKAGAAYDAGIAPADTAATPVVDELVGAFAASAGRGDEPAYRRELLDNLEAGNEPRGERYWQLLATINGWPKIPSTTHLWGWFIEALRTRS